jgi:hypothetical protein
VVSSQEDQPQTRYTQPDKFWKKTLEYNNETHHLFTDFQAGYDKANRQQLTKAMQELGITQKYIRLVDMS